MPRNFSYAAIRKIQLWKGFAQRVRRVWAYYVPASQEIRRVDEFCILDDREAIDPISHRRWICGVGYQQQLFVRPLQHPKYIDDSALLIRQDRSTR